MELPYCIGMIVLFQFIVGQTQSTKLGLSRQDLHIQRKLQHFISGMMIYMASELFSVETDVTVLLTFAFIYYILHLLRQRFEQVDKFYLASFHGILRKEEVEMHVLPGAFYFLLGSSLVLALFPTTIARLSILHLSVGDPAASLFGTLYGTTRFWHGKSCEGFMGCWIATSIATGLSMYATSSSSICCPSIVIGFGAAMAESIYLGYDDNLTLPLLSAGFQWMVQDII